MSALVVTGGFGTLGQALGHAAVQQGWRVALVDLAQTAPPGLSDAGMACFPGVELTDEAATARLFERIATGFDGITALANVAGGFTWAPFETAHAEAWESMFAMNVLTCVSASRAALPALRRSNGSIVNIGAAGALHAGAGMGPYAAAKSAVHRFTEALAEEARVYGVRVNAVLPTIIDTPANRRDMPDADRKAWVAPEDLAQVILFLASTAARAVNGVLLPVTR